MDIVATHVGIDAHLKTLVCCIQGQKPVGLPNAEQPLRDWSARLPAGAIVHLEASGCYERLARRVLLELDFEVRVHNPFRTKHLFNAVGKKAKTDKIDAKTLAEKGALLPVTPAKSLERQELADLSRTIQSLKKEMTRWKKRMNRPEICEDARACCQRMVEFQEVEIKRLEKRSVELLRPLNLQEGFDLVRTIPCVGPVCSRILLAELPEDWRVRSPKQIAAYSGLAATDHSSGEKETAHLAKGNTNLKSAFYMPAVRAITMEGPDRELYKRLRLKGKTHNQAIVPVMRKLLIRCIVVLQRGSSWQDEPPKPPFPRQTHKIAA